MPDSPQSISQITPLLAPAAKILASLAALALAYFLMRVIQAIPLAIVVDQEGQRIDYSGFFKNVAVLGIWAIIGIHIAVILILPLLMVAKLALLEFLAVAILACWVCILNSNSWARSLLAIQSECELANNLTFLQGEMVRSQLEDINTRIHKQLEPPELDATQTLLQVLSPAVMLLVQKERSLMKWSMAAVNIGKTLTKFFKNSPKNSAS